GIRFHNEALFAIERGYFVVQVTCPEEIRHERFRAVGEDLSRLNDPFEAELETLPCHLVIGGVWNPAYAVATIRRSYQYLLERQTEMQHAA
ncbi:MAG TPA: hypothetical protein PKA05_13945, partial [Roseiflexaceae bacterium]|nr:hypothetical protein [Roseiflexaceae bacterium]